MVSVLGNYTYEFPQEFPLKLRLKDMLETEVDEKYYLSGKMMNYLHHITETNKARGNGNVYAPADIEGVSKCVTTKEGQRVKDNFIEDPSCGGGNLEPKIVEDFYKNRDARVYEECSPTLRSGREGLKVVEPKVIDPFICASRGRNPENPSDRRAGIHLEQRLEPNFSGCTNTITTVQKDNYVAEPQGFRSERTEYGKSIRKQYESGEIYEKIGNMRELKPRTDGVSNTITTLLKDNYVAEPTINVVGNYSPSNHDASRIVATDGIAPTVKENHGTVTGVVENCYVSEKGVKFICSPKRGMATDINADICQPLTAKGQANWTGSFVSPDIENLEKSSTIGSQEPTKINLTDGSQITSNDNLSGLRIRKLTPKECWRLMGFDDADFEKAAQVNFNSQLYKQAGNSIVVDVLYYIFKEMF